MDSYSYGSTQGQIGALNDMPEELKLIVMSAFQQAFEKSSSTSHLNFRCWMYQLISQWKKLHKKTQCPRCESALFLMKMPCHHVFCMQCSRLRNYCQILSRNACQTCIPILDQLLTFPNNQLSVSKDNRILGELSQSGEDKSEMSSLENKLIQFVPSGGRKGIKITLPSRKR